MGVVVTILLLGGLVGFALVWLGSQRAIHPEGGAAAPLQGGEAVTISSSTGARLSGHFFRGSSRATVVLSHGYGGSEGELAPVAAGLRRAGFSVFTYDLRGCGASTGAVTFGALEARDLRAVVHYLSGRPDVDATRIGAYGFSMGGAATILAAAADARIRAVAADSAWSDVRHWVRDRVLRRPDNRFSTLALRLAELRTHTSFLGLRPVRAAAALHGRPLLLLHGEADAVVPVADARANALAAGASATLWVVPGATHVANIEPGGAATSPRLAAFFEQALRREEAA